jgi:hypothetical protein
VSTTETPSVTWLRWARQHGIDPNHPPPSYQRYRSRRVLELDGLANQIERAEARVAAAEGRRSRERAERRLENLLDRRDVLEERLSELDDLALDWRWRCATCDAPIEHESWSYGRGLCDPCKRGAGQ